jgi:hypothetical protein
VGLSSSFKPIVNVFKGISPLPVVVPSFGESLCFLRSAFSGYTRRPVPFGMLIQPLDDFQGVVAWRGWLVGLDSEVARQHTLENSFKQYSKCVFSVTDIGVNQGKLFLFEKRQADVSNVDRCPKCHRGNVVCLNLPLIEAQFP